MLLCYLMIFLLICIIKYNINGKNNHYRNIWEVRTELCKILIKNTFKSGVSKQLKETKKIGVIPQQQEGLQLQFFRETRGGRSTRKPGIGNTERGTMGNCCHSRVLLLLGAEKAEKRKKRAQRKKREEEEKLPWKTDDFKWIPRSAVKESCLPPPCSSVWFWALNPFCSISSPGINRGS